MRVILKRSGGMAGMSRQWQLDERGLAPAKIQELRSFVDQANFFALPSEIGGTGQLRDSFAYQLTVEDGGKTHTINCAEAALSEPLRNFIGWVMKSAR
jgi:hypothetical protein